MGKRVKMNRGFWIAILAFTACAAFISGWHIEHRRILNASSPGHSLGNANPAKAAFSCEDAADDQWHTVRIFDYQPAKTLYSVVWEVCLADIEGRRVRVTDSSMQKVFYEYEDDQILRVEEAELLGNQAPQLLIVTASAGTNDRIDWHVLSEVNGKLQEWQPPNYDAAAEKLLQPNEDFCCKEWNSHLRGHDIFLARGIYHKNEDGNCCPSRGGVLVSLKPIHDGFKLISVHRISRPEYDRWRSQPFCSQCTLTDP